MKTEQEKRGEYTSKRKRKFLKLKHTGGLTNYYQQKKAIKEPEIKPEIKVALTNVNQLNKIMAETKYSFKKTAEKFLIALVEIIIAGTIVYLTENSLFLILVPALEAIRNWWKHK